MCEDAYYFVLVMNWSCEQVSSNISSQCLSIIQPAFLPIFELPASGIVKSFSFTPTYRDAKMERRPFVIIRLLLNFWP